MKRIVFDPDRCNLCNACRIACSAGKKGSVQPDLSRIRIETAGDAKPLRAVVCQHCQDPVCVTACMRGIIHQDEQTGIVSRRYEDCFRCAACHVYCPVGAAVEDSDLQAFVTCDLCGGAEIPLCVQVCENGALHFEEESETSRRRRERYASGMFGGNASGAASETAELSEAQWQTICAKIEAFCGVRLDPAACRETGESLKAKAREVHHG